MTFIDNASALTTIQQQLQQWNLSALLPWAQAEIQQGASTAQVMLDLYQQPTFRAAYPAIFTREAKGLPPISPADVLSYKDTMAQLEHQYNLVPGLISSDAAVNESLGNDVSASEMTDRVAKGLAPVLNSPPSVRTYMAANFGVAGDGALMSHYLDLKTAEPLLEQQTAASEFGGQAAIGGVNLGVQDAMTLAQLGVSQSTFGSGLSDLEQKQGLYNQQVGETNQLSQAEGIESEFGLSAKATQDVLRQQQQRTAEFAGGGAPISDQFGEAGAGAARPE